jgi:hypothetical protein
MSFFSGVKAAVVLNLMCIPCRRAETEPANLVPLPTASVPSPEKFTSSLELASRLLFTVAVDSSQPDVAKRYFPWPDGKSIKEDVAAEVNVHCLVEYPCLIGSNIGNE